MKAVISVEATQVITIRCSSIRPFGGQPRTDFDETRLQELAASLHEHGQQVAAIVRRLPEPVGPFEFELVDGERRYRAAQLNEGPHAPLRCEVRGAKDDDHQFVQSVVSNFGRADHTPLESCLAVARVCKMPEYSALPTLRRHERVGALFARSGHWVEAQLKLVSLPEEVREMLGAPERRLNTQVALFLSTVREPEEQVRLAKQITQRELKPPQARLLIRASQASAGIQPRRPSIATNIVFSNITKISQTAETLLDMPKKSLNEALARPEVRASMVRRLDQAAGALQQLRAAVAPPDVKSA